MDVNFTYVIEVSYDIGNCSVPPQQQLLYYSYY